MQASDRTRTDDDLGKPERGADRRSHEPPDALLARAGDMEAFERLYRRHCAMVHSLARRMLGATEADDATQRVFVQAWRSLSSYEGKGPFAAWLRRLAVRGIVDHWRRLPAIELVDGSVIEAVRSEPPPADDAVAIEAALARLPGRARLVLLLHDVEGYTHEEIGRRLGVSSGTSKSQLHRARGLMRRLLTGGIDG